MVQTPEHIAYRSEQKLVAVGASVFSGICAIVAFTVIWLFSQFEAEFDHFQMRFTGGVNGVGDGTLVKYNGVEVGKVQSIALDRTDPQKVLVTVYVRPGLNIRKDSVATVQSANLVGGSAFIEIAGGSANAPVAAIRKEEPYTEILTKESGFAQLGKQFGVLNAQLRPLEKNWKLLNSTENRDALDRIGGNISNISAVINNNSARFALMKGNYNNIERNMELLSAHSTSLNPTLNNVSVSFRELQANSNSRFDDTFSQSFSQLSTDLSRTGRGFGAFVGLVKDNPIVLVKGKTSAGYEASNDKAK